EKVPDGWKRSTAEISGGELLIDGGVKVKLNPILAEYIKVNGISKLDDLMLERYGYVMRGLDNAVIGQFGRQIAYGRDIPSRFTFLEGSSGTGKTRIIEIFSDMTGYENLPFTIHQHTELFEFRGGHLYEGGVVKVVNTTPFIENEKKGPAIINFSEANTADRNGLLNYLYPEMAGRANRLMPEVAKKDTRDGERFYSNKISPDTLFVADINPAGEYASRNPIS
ncbi:MAG TPA: AAA family ATPase, partial [Candidatus Omnitrophota bacterium]|nr:AAA family ATPase [Candidatus Omnitrophota bacterium]